MPYLFVLFKKCSFTNKLSFIKFYTMSSTYVQQRKNVNKKDDNVFKTTDFRFYKCLPTYFQWSRSTVKLFPPKWNKSF